MIPPAWPSYKQPPLPPFDKWRVFSLRGLKKKPAA
jgi:hypothetical protein